MPRFTRIREPVAQFGKRGSYIDEGGNATVYQTTRGYAVKIISKKGESEGLLKEVCILRNLNHPNIIKLLCLYCAPKKRFIYMELGETTLQNYISMGDSPREPEWYLYQLLRALEYCHANNIIHRDVKPHNVLICKGEQVRLIDFGLAKSNIGEGGVTHTGEIITRWWRPPEILLGKRDYGCEVDMWSAGLVLLEILTGMLPKGNTEREQLRSIFMLTGTPSKTEWPESRDLPYWNSSIPVYKKSCIKANTTGLKLVHKLVTWPHQRFSATRALRHPYFHNVRRELESKFSFVGTDRGCRRPNRSGFNKRNRYKALEWLWQIKEGYNYSYSTLFTAYAIFDKYIELGEPINKDDLQGLSAMALFIATKLLEVDYLDLGDYAKVCVHQYTEEQLQKYETQLLQTIDYLVDPPYTSLLKEVQLSSPIVLYFMTMYLNYDWVTDWSPNKFVGIFSDYVCGSLNKQLTSKLNKYFKSLTGDIAKELHKNLFRM